jgi:hypothetical protein
MLIFGHPWIESNRFVKVFSVEEIGRTQPGDVILLEPLNVSIELAKYCREHDLPFAVTVSTNREAIFANALDAAYIIAEHELAITIQKIADEYLFDTRILVLVESEKRIETMARFSIDGVIFPEAIVQL